MVETRTVVHVADLAAELRYTERLDEGMVAAVELGGVRTFVAVPMLKENELIGALIVYRQEVRPFTDKQIALVTNFAAQAVIAIENARLLSELRQRTTDLTELLEQQTATSEVLQTISGSPGNVQPVFDTMLAEAVRICDATFGNIQSWNGETFQVVATHNTPPALVEAAKPGQILISPRVLMAVKDAVAVESVGEFELKGIRRPIAAYNVLATSSQGT